MRRRRRAARVVVAVVVCAACAVITAVAASISVHRDGSSVAVSTPPSAPTDRQQIAIVGESYARDSSAQGAGQYWATQLAGSLGANVEVASRHGAWVEHTGNGEQSLADEVRATAEGSAIIVIMASPADIERPRVKLQRIASAAISAARERAPRASIVLVGPAAGVDVTSPSPSPYESSPLRAALLTAAEIGQARYLDPVRAGWFQPVQSSDLVGGRLDESEQSVLSDRLTTALSSLSGGA